MEAGIYGPCDRAIKRMNRRNLKYFGQLKLADFDELSIVRTVKKLYRKAAREAAREYLDIAYDAYILGLMMCDIDVKKTEKMAQKAITKEWVEDVLNQTDFVTLYRFYSEAERKAERLIEAIAIADDIEDRGDARRNIVINRDAQIDQALKMWVTQLSQYAINVTDYAVLNAFDDAGVEEAEWVTQTDERRCSRCAEMDGRTYRLDEFPSKPHPRCRCTARPILKHK